MHIAPKRRSFMFLQGPASPFFAQVGRALVRAGYSTARVNFCGGDRIFWRSRQCGDVVDFSGRAEDWPAFLRAEMLKRAATDVVVFGDCRPIHEVAASAAQELGATFWSFEEGYLRPDWITLEMGGTNGRSSLPREPEDILARAGVLPVMAPPMRVSKGALSSLVVRQLAYEAANILLRPLFPTYRTHRPCSPLAEAWGWLQRIGRLPSRRISARRVMDRILKGRAGSYFLLPLQLDADYQLRAHSPYGSMSDVLRDVIASFATHAPQHVTLIAKIHPLHNGMPDLWREAMVTAKAHGVHDRVIVLDGGHLPTLLRESAGVVTVNSTVGMSALGHLRPVKVLGSAFYDLHGLTFQGTLDVFWKNAQGPDPALLSAFRRVVAHDTQINGSFHTRAGMGLGVEAAVRRLVGPRPCGYGAAGRTALAALAGSAGAYSPVQPSVAVPYAGGAMVNSRSAVLVHSSTFSTQPRTPSAACAPGREDRPEHRGANGRDYR